LLCFASLFALLLAGSGKTMVMELVILHYFRNTLERNDGSMPAPQHIKKKVVYIAPLKALCEEKFNEWKQKFGEILKMKVSMVTGKQSNSRSGNAMTSLCNA
jgi:ATP-dependent DNA helicase HFM1/MER3